MIEVVEIPIELANGVEKELYSIKPQWSYFDSTTDFYNRASQEQQKVIDKHSKNYGPVIDTQRFSYIVYQHGYGATSFYSSIKTNPNSYHRKYFTFLPKLIDYLQDTYIPNNYEVERIFVNMQTVRPRWSMNNIHPDLKMKGGITILYYVNDSDGDTYFFNNIECIKSVSPTKGKAVVYPADTFHAGSTPVTTETRTVINLVFIPRDMAKYPYD